jgi:hypothetical protein
MFLLLRYIGLVENRNSTPDLFWTVHPLRRNWISSLLIIGFLSLIGLMIYSAYGILLALLSIALLFGSLSSYFFPTKYAIYPDRVEVKTLTRRQSRRWDYFKSFYPFKNGVLLSPFEKRSRLERYRGLYILTYDDSDEILRYIESKVNRSDDGNSRISSEEHTG